MGRINLKGVIVGGLAAGLVLNIFDYIFWGLILAKTMNASLAWVLIGLLHAVGEAPLQLFPTRLMMIGTPVARFYREP